jgi:O-6-methylguanine DNA methyltransferase
MQTLDLPTRLGTFTASFSERGLARIDFPGSAPDRGSAGDAGGFVSSPQFRQWQWLTAAALKNIVAGRQPTELPPLDLSCGTDFQRRVWSALLRIDVGQIRTYSEIAAAIDRPGAARAVGAACGANPIPVLIPCHRVVAASGELGGFTAGLEWKRRLLANEGAARQVECLPRS